MRQPVCPVDSGPAPCAFRRYPGRGPAVKAQPVSGPARYPIASQPLAFPSDELYGAALLPSEAGPLYAGGLR